MPGSAQLAYIDIQPRCLDPGNFENKTPPVFEPFRLVPLSMCNAVIFF